MEELYQTFIKISNLINPNLDISAHHQSQSTQDSINFVEIFSSIAMSYDLNFMVIESHNTISELEDNHTITTSHGGWIPYAYIIFDKDVDFVSSCNLKNIVKLSHSICHFEYKFTDQVVYD